MLHRVSFILIVLTGGALLATGANAEMAPSCPGGGTATGTFHCSGPVLHPVCEEGPPWSCPIKSTLSGGLMEFSDDNGGGGHPHGHGHNGDTVFGRLSSSAVLLR